MINNRICTKSLSDTSKSIQAFNRVVNTTRPLRRSVAKELELKKQYFPAFFPSIYLTDSCRSLLLQFLLSKVFKSHEEILTEENPHYRLMSEFSFDWGVPICHLTQLLACIQDLEIPFLKYKQVLRALNKTASRVYELCHKKGRSRSPLEKTLRLILIHIEPLIISCKNDENLFLFLLKHEKQIAQLMQTDYLYNLLIKIHPEGLEVVGEKLCSQYYRRGFFSQISECKLLLTQILHARSFTPTHL